MDDANALTNSTIKYTLRLSNYTYFNMREEKAIMWLHPNKKFTEKGLMQLNMLDDMMICIFLPKSYEVFTKVES